MFVGSGLEIEFEGNQSKSLDSANSRRGHSLACVGTRFGEGSSQRDFASGLGRGGVKGFGPHRNAVVDFPDFTRGRWGRNPPLKRRGI